VGDTLTSKFLTSTSTVYAESRFLYQIALLISTIPCIFETMPAWLGALIAFLWSLFKYMFGVATIFLTQDLSPLLGFLITLAGSMTGVFIYVYAGEWLLERWLAGRKKKKTFSRTSRRIVRVKTSGGLIGIAILTPVLLTIPVGCLVAIAMEHHRMRIVRVMFFSLLGWGTLIFGLKAIFDIDITAFFTKP
jgi:hypothetical protein